jgi:Domain of unknown function (DUF4282)
VACHEEFIPLGDAMSDRSSSQGLPDDWTHGGHAARGQYSGADPSDVYDEGAAGSYRARTADVYGTEATDTYDAGKAEFLGARTAVPYGVAKAQFGTQNADPFVDRNADPFGDRKVAKAQFGTQNADPFVDRNADPFGDRKADAFGDRKADAFGDRKADAFGDRKADPFGGRNARLFGDHNAGPFGTETAVGYGAGTADAAAARLDAGPPTVAIQRPSTGEAPDSKGFLSALFDWGFTSFVTPKVIKVLYVLILIGTVIASLIFTIIMFRVSAGFGLLTLLIGDPLFIVIVMAIYRIILEYFIVTFRVAEDIRALRERGDLR